MVDAQSPALPHQRLPSAALAIEREAVDRVEKVKRAAQLGQDPVDYGPHSLGSELALEVVDRRARVQAELIVDEQIVAQAVLDAGAVARPERAAESMDPAEKRQAERPTSGPPELLVDVTLLAAESAQPRIQPRPGRPATGEHAEALHADLKRPGLGVEAARIHRPHAVHRRPPHRIEVGPVDLEVIAEQRALQQVR